MFHRPCSSSRKAVMTCRQDKDQQKADAEAADGDDGLRIAWQYRRLLKKQGAAGATSALKGTPSRWAIHCHMQI